MKKQLFRYLSGIIPAIALFTSVNGQVEKPSLESNYNEIISNEAKANPVTTKDRSIVNINTNALKEFKKCFKDADKTSWYAIQHGFLAKFTTNDVQTRVFYDLKGRWTATIRTYSQDKLPAEVRKQVRSNYYDYSIYVVNEIMVGDKTAYLVSIEDRESIKTICVTENEMDVYEDFKKG